MLNIPGHPFTRIQDIPSAQFGVADSHFLRTLGIPLIQGRDFAESDSATSPPVALIGEEFKSRYFPTEDPLGRPIHIEPPPFLQIAPGANISDSADVTIIGVVGDFRNAGLAHPPEPQITVLYSQHPVVNYCFKDIVIRTASEPRLLVPEIRRHEFGSRHAFRRGANDGGTRLSADRWTALHHNFVGFLCGSRSLQVVTEAHMRGESATYIRADVAGAGADRKEIDILHGSSGCLQTVQNRAATCFHGAAQIALIQLIRPFSAIQSAFQIKMAMIDIAIQEDLADALARVTRSMKALLLCEPNQWVGCSDTEDPRMVHWSPANSCEASVSPS